MYGAFTKLLNISLISGILALVVMLLRIILKRVPKKYLCVLWMLVALRLLMPVSISSTLSAYNVVVPQTDETGQITYFQYNERTEKPQLYFDVPIITSESFSKDGISAEMHTSDVYMPTVVTIWLIGAACMLIYAFASYVSLKRLTAVSILEKNNIFICDDISFPFILGIVKAKVYLPSGMDCNTKENVLAHEKAHLARHDHWWKPLGFVLLSVHWFNPILWVAYVLFCRDIESACDEKVITGMDRSHIAAYSTALLSCATQHRKITACPVAFGETDVKGRVKNVLSYKRPSLWAIISAVAVCAVVAVCFLTNPNTHQVSLEAPSTRVFKGVVTQISGKSMLVTPEEGAWELSSSDMFSIPIEHMESSLEPQIGDIIEILYGGSIAETYPASLENIIHVRVIEKKDKDVADSIPEENPLPPYLAATTVPFKPDDIHEIVLAEVHEDYGDFMITSPETLTWLEKQLSNAEEITESNCPFGTVIYLYREDGTLGTIEPAEDSCSVFRSNGKYYQLKGTSVDIFSTLGIQQNYYRVSVTQDGDNHILTLQNYSWAKPDGKPTVAIYDRHNRLVRCENNLMLITYEYDDVGYCIGRTEYHIDRDGNVHESPNRVFTYNYDRGEHGLVSTVRYDAENNLTTVFKFNDSDVRANVLSKAVEYVEKMPTEFRKSIINIEDPFFARVSPWVAQLDADLMNIAEGYEQSSFTITELAYVVVFKTDSTEISSPIAIYIDSQGEVIGMMGR